MNEYVLINNVVKKDKYDLDPVLEPAYALKFVDGQLTAYSSDDDFEKYIKGVDENKFVFEDEWPLSRLYGGSYSKHTFFKDGDDLAQFNEAVEKMGYKPRIVASFAKQQPNGQWAGTSGIDSVRVI